MSISQALRTFHQRHEQVKHLVHNSMRYPLPPAGRYFMGFVYFLIPVVGGYGVMQWAIGKAHASIGANGEHLPIKDIQGLGDKRVIATDDDKSATNTDDKEGKKILQTVGAGGWGGGVHLAVSDQDTQRKNREKLNQFLLLQKRKHEKKQQQKQQRREELPEEKQ